MKTKTIGVRVTPEEFAKIKKAAEKESRSLADFIRLHILNLIKKKNL